MKKNLVILVERQPEKQTGFLCGYSENYIRTHLEGAKEEDINKLVPVRITRVDKHTTIAQQQDIC